MENTIKEQIKELKKNIYMIHNQLFNGNLTLEDAKNIHQIITTCQMQIGELEKVIKLPIPNKSNKEFNKAIFMIIILGIFNGLTIFLLPQLSFFTYLISVIYIIFKNPLYKGLSSQNTTQDFNEFKECKRLFSFKEEVFRQKLLKLATNLNTQDSTLSESEVEELSYLAFEANAFINGYIDGFSIEIKNEETKEMAKKILQNGLQTDIEDLDILLEMAKIKVQSESLNRNRIKTN